MSGGASRPPPELEVQRQQPRLILASASASRRALLEGAGLVFTVQPAAVDEDEVKQTARGARLDAEATALRLAELKAQTVAHQHPEAIVIGADQILVCGGSWFDKPESIAAAREQLRALRGLSHRLATAVVCHHAGRQRWSHIAAPTLTMRCFSDDFLERYLAYEAENVTTTVGAYRLEGPGAQLFSAIEGDHSSILGLPLLPLLAFLREAGVLLD